MNRFVKLILLSILLILFTACMVLLFLWYKNGCKTSIAVLAGLLLYTLLMVILFLFVDTEPSKTSQEINDFYDTLRNSLSAENHRMSITGKEGTRTEETTDILKLMSINMREIKEYYVLSKNMARSSFRLSVSMCLLGFTLIASSIISVFILDTGLGSAVVPAIGGAIVEVVAGTTLLVYKQSLDQLNKYYEALHENERFLSVVNITDKVSPEKKDEAYMEIIQSQLSQKETSI